MRDIKHIVGIGCSYTRHSIEDEEPWRPSHNPEHIDRNNFSYITELANNLGATSENLSIGGIGNHHIFQKLYNHVKYNTDIESTLYVIGSTYVHRRDFPHPTRRDAKFSVPLYPNSLKKVENELYKALVEMWETPIEEILTFAKIWWERIFSEKEAYRELERYIETYKALVHQKNGNIVIINTCNPDNDINGTIRKNVYEFDNGITCWREYIKTYDETYGMKHPNYDDHRRLGQLLYQYINI